MIHETARIHPTAAVDEPCDIGAGARVWHFCHVREGAKIGAHAQLGQNVYVGKDVSIGAGAKVQNNVSVYEAVTLEAQVFCGPSCVFTNVTNPRAHIERKHEFKPTLVKRGATIGANATILCGITIGRWAMIGAGAVLRESVPDFALVVGVPAKRIGWVCHCGCTLNERNGWHCDACGADYGMNEDALLEMRSPEPPPPAESNP